MKRLSILLLICSVISSCNFYKPALVNTPLLETKHDGNVSISLGRTFGVQASYSPFENIGVLFNYSNAFPVYEYRNIDGEPNQVLFNTFNNQQYEFGVGYYKRLDDQNYFEVYLGYGKGEAGVVEDDIFTYDEFNADRAFESLHEQWFIQPTFAFTPEERIRLAVSAKMMYSNFYNFNASPFFKHSASYFLNSTIFSIQPTFSVVFEEKWFRGFFQAGFFVAERSEFFTSRWLNSSLGMGLNIHQLKKSIKEKRKPSGDYWE